MKGCQYKNGGIPVQGSFQPAESENMTISSVASVSSVLSTTEDSEIALSLLTAAHVDIGPTPSATASSMVLPAGIWFLLVPKGSAISLLMLSGASSGQASVIKLVK